MWNHPAAHKIQRSGKRAWYTPRIRDARWCRSDDADRCCFSSGAEAPLPGPEDCTGVQLAVRELTQGSPELITHLFVSDDDKQQFSHEEKGGDTSRAVGIALAIVGENFIGDWALSATWGQNLPPK